MLIIVLGELRGGSDSSSRPAGSPVTEPRATGTGAQAAGSAATLQGQSSDCGLPPEAAGQAGQCPGKGGIAALYFVTIFVTLRIPL